jgi:hypothetical protein
VIGYVVVSGSAFAISSSLGAEQAMSVVSMRSVKNRDTMRFMVVFGGEETDIG